MAEDSDLSADDRGKDCTQEDLNKWRIPIGFSPWYAVIKKDNETRQIARIPGKSDALKVPKSRASHHRGARP